MPGPLDDVCLARLPADRLPLLAAFRTAPGLRVWPDGDSVWLRWEPGDDALLRCVLPIAGAELFARRGQHWHRLGEALPSFEAAAVGEGELLVKCLVPEPLTFPTTVNETPLPIQLTLVADGQPRPTTALRCTVDHLAKWADSATSRQLAAVRAVMCEREAILLGAKLPLLPAATRYCGKSVFVPLGLRPEPDLPESALRETLGLAADEIVLLDAQGAEVIERSSFAPLTRAAARLALRR